MEGMTIIEFRDRVIREAEESVNKMEYRPFRKRGCLEGLRIAKSIEPLMDCFQQEIMMRHEIENAMRTEDKRGFSLAEREKHIEQFWEFRCATAQLEFVLESLKVGYHSIGLYDGPLSANAVIRYAAIVGVKGNQV
jgi:hypothetical protein